MNNLPGYKIRGENYNALLHIYSAYKSILASKKHAKTKTNPDWPFYMAEYYDESLFFKDMLSSFINNIIKPDGEQHYGFKEVKYADFGNDLYDFLILLKQNIPNLKVIFNFRDHESVANSAWQKNRNADTLKKEFKVMEAQCVNFNKVNSDTSVIIQYDKYTKNHEELIPLFKLLDLKYNRSIINDVFSKQLNHCK